MSRARNIKPGIFKNEILGVADPLLTLLFQSLWCLADRDGVLEDRPLRIRAETFPYREIRDMDGMLSELARFGFIVRYKVGAAAYIQVMNFAKHQNPHKNEKPSGLPTLTDRTDIIGSDTEKIGSAPADSLLLIPDSKELPPTAVAEATQLDPIFGVGLDFLTRKSVPERAARSFLGLLRKEVKDDLTVAELLTEAERQDVSDPCGWLRAAVKRRRSTGPPTNGATSKYGKAIEDLERMKTHGHERPDFGAHAAADLPRLRGNPGG